jgi:prevent-host-death family protein
MKSISALEARKKFGGLLDRVARKGEHILISRVNQPLAVLIPYKDYQENFGPSARREKLLRVADKMDLWRREHQEKVKGLDTTQLIREMRASE